MIKTTNKELEKLAKIARELGWIWETYRLCCIELRKYSPAGKEYRMAIEFKEKAPVETFLKSLKKHSDNFDVDLHTEMWISERGQNGVPRTIKELLDDAEAIKEMIAELYDKLSNTEVNSSTRRVKQISLDILVDEDVDGEELAEIIASTVEEHEYVVMGSSFQEDMTETYSRDYPELLANDGKTNSIRINLKRLYKSGHICLTYGGMIIYTKEAGEAVCRLYTCSCDPSLCDGEAVNVLEKTSAFVDVRSLTTGRGIRFSAEEFEIATCQ